MRDAHANPRALQKALFIKPLQFSYFQPIVKQIVVINFKILCLCIWLHDSKLSTQNV